MAWFFKKKNKSIEEQKTTIGLSKTKESLGGKISSLFQRKKINDDFFDELEEILIASDVGIETTLHIMEELRESVNKKSVENYEELKQLLKNIISNIVIEKPFIYHENKLNIIFVLGVNGVGKTTNIGKLAKKFKDENLKVQLAACDTFRAAAIEQLELWSKKIDVPIVKQQSGADPGAVLYNALDAAKARNIDLLIVDTAGRLHNRVNLMQEIAKLNKIFSKKYPDENSYYKENLLVVDANTGQNAFQQAKTFNETIGITSILLSKLDSSSKGGIVLPLSYNLEIPIKFIGVGEKEDDLIEFNKEKFIDSLL